MPAIAHSLPGLTLYSLVYPELVYLATLAKGQFKTNFLCSLA